MRREKSLTEKSKQKHLKKHMKNLEKYKKCPPESLERREAYSTHISLAEILSNAWIDIIWTPIISRFTDKYFIIWVYKLRECLSKFYGCPVIAYHPKALKYLNSYLREWFIEVRIIPMGSYKVIIHCINHTYTG